MRKSLVFGTPEGSEPHLQNVRYGSEPEVQQTRAGCLLLAISGHSLVRRVLLGALGPDRLGAGLHLCRLVAAPGLTRPVRTR